MPTDRKGLRRLSIIIFAVGVLAGLLFSAFLIWAGLEATLFDPDFPGDTNLNLHCPLVLTRGETGHISASFTNTATWKVNLTVRAHFSHGYLSLIREESTLLALDPGESQEVRWTVTSEDRLYRNFIFVKVANFRQMPIPGRIGTCGIIVLDLPILSGIQIVVLIVGLAVICIFSGIALWRVATRQFPAKGRSVMRAMSWLTVAVVACLLSGILRAWLPGVLAFVVSLLLIGEIGVFYVQSR